MRIAVTGKAGQVVTSLVERGGQTFEIVPLGRPELDLADSASILRTIEAARPDAVVSAAAYTAVDKAETEPDVAFAINATGAGEVARAAAKLGVPLVHISTDYVFDGTKPTPYSESDPVAPLGVYGASKEAGERMVLAACPEATILRTAWVYSPFGANFVKTMLRVAKTRAEVNVVADQFGNPTSALDIADAVLKVISRQAKEPGLAGGIFHMAGSGDATWADLASEVFAISEKLGGPAAEVKPIPTREYPTPAARPANSRLDCSRWAAVYGSPLPDWRVSLQQVVTRLVNEEEQV